MTVPGAVDAWWAMHQRFGTLDWDRLLWPAVAYAEDGIAVHERVARDWALHVSNVTDDADATAQYLNAGKAYAAGALSASRVLLRLYAKFSATVVTASTRVLSWKTWSASCARSAGCMKKLISPPPRLSLSRDLD